MSTSKVRLDNGIIASSFLNKRAILRILLVLTLSGLLFQKFTAQAQSPPLGKEYIYIGGKLVATVVPTLVPYDCGGEVPIASAPSSPPPDTVWVEDAIPAGATASPASTYDRNWIWDTTQKASGTKSHTDTAALGIHGHAFTGAPGLYIAPADKLVTYLLINPCNPPREIMLHWQDSSGSWDHRAYWGENLINNWGSNGTPSRYPMGVLPLAGEWVRLEVPATAVGLGVKSVIAMTFMVYDGQAWFDKTGKWTPP